MSKSFRTAFRSMIVLAAVVAALQERAADAINIGTINFASTANGGTAVTDPNGSNAAGAINGNLDAGPPNSAAWGTNRVGGVWTGTLSPSAVGSAISEVRIYDRNCCTSFAPYTIDILNASNAVLHSQSNSTVLERPHTFTIPNIVGAAKLRVTHNGTTPGDAYVGEIEVIGFNGYVAGVNSIGSQVLDSSITGTTAAGNLANARVVQLTLTETTGSINGNFAEFRVFNSALTNVALQSNSGVAYERVDTPASGFGVQPSMTAATGPNFAGQINDGSISTFSDSVGYTGDFFAIGLASNSTLSSIQLENRNGCCNGQGNMRLQVYSDAARASLIYDAPVVVSRTPNAITNLSFQLGGTAVAALENGRTYTMDINATSGLSDLLSVRQLQAASTQLTVDGDLIVNLLAGTLEAGDVFNLFDADTFAGAFDSITLPTLVGLRWNTSNLLVNGTLAVAVLVPEPSTILICACGLPLLLVSARRRRHAQLG